MINIINIFIGYTVYLKRTKAKNMYKNKILLLTIIVITLNGCSILPFVGKKKNNSDDAVTTASIAMYDSTLYTNSSSSSSSVEPDSVSFSQFMLAQSTSDGTTTTVVDSSADSSADDGLEDISSIISSADDADSYLSDDQEDVYKEVIQGFQDEITKLKSELETITMELYQLKAKSQIWENPFSIYNKEIILNNGSTVFGKITYQDQDILYVETLIGGLTIQRQNIKRVIENVTQIEDSTTYYDDYSRRNDILEIKKEEDGTMFEPSTKLLANSILLGDIKEVVDFRGNRILSGEIKNIGEARADFVKINFIFRMNWQGKTKSLTSYVRGSKHTFKDPNIETDSSIEIDAIAAFELVIPPDFGEFIGYSYTIDWEQYDD